MAMLVLGALIVMLVFAGGVAVGAVIRHELQGRPDVFAVAPVERRRTGRR